MTLRRAVAALLGVCLSAGAGDASGRLVFSHLGSDNPALAGWGGSFAATVVRTAVSGSGIGDDLPAWQIYDTSTTSGSTGAYLRTPSGTDLAAADQLGWVVLTTLRVPAASDALDASIYLELATDDRRFGLAFGSDASGNALVQLFGNGGPVHTVPGATFHTYELRYRAASATADLYVDGALIQAGSSGLDAGTVAPRFIFGSAQSNSIGRGQYHRVEWIIHDDADSDGVGDPDDNCAYLGNPDQADGAGVGEGSGPDGRGNVCQCADLDLDGGVDSADLALLRDHLSEPDPGLPAAALAKCSASDDASACDVGTATRIARALDPLPPTIGDRCGAATGFGALCGDGVCTGEPTSCWSTPPGCQADCGKCLLGSPCNVDADCASANCAGGACASNVPDPVLSIPGDGRCDPGERCTGTVLGTDPDSCGPCQLQERCSYEADCAGDLRCLRRGECSVTGVPCAIPLVQTTLACAPTPTYPPNICIPSPTGELCSEPAPFGTSCEDDADCEPFDAVVGECDLGVNACICPDGTQFNPACGALDAGTPCLCQSTCVTVNNLCPDGAACYRNGDCAEGGCQDWTVCLPTGCGGAGEPLCAAGAPCTSTSECASGLFCHLFFCRAPFPDGAVCTASFQCAGGICNFGACTSELRGDGEPCTTDAVCQSGVCELLQCRVPICGNGSCSSLSERCGTFTPGPRVACAVDCGKCGLNDVCGANVDCESGFCDPNFTNDPRCRDCRDANAGLCPNGENCDDDIDCQAGSICQSSYCAPPPPSCSGTSRPNGCQCTSNGQCSSNLCASIPGHPDVCAPASCAGDLPGSFCTSHADCCDFPGVNVYCSFFVCQP